MRRGSPAFEDSRRHGFRAACFRAGAARGLKRTGRRTAPGKHAAGRVAADLDRGVLMHRSIAAIVFGALAFPVLAQMTPAGVWHTIDDKTGEVSSEVRITDDAGVLSGRIENLLRKNAKQDDVCHKCSAYRKAKPVL